VQHFGADYGPGGIGLLVRPLLGEAILLVLRPHSVLVLRDGDTLNLIAERFGTTVATLRRINPQLESTQTITSVDGDSLAVLAGRHGTTESKLRSLNRALQQSETYLTGEGETFSSMAAEQNLSLSLLRQFNPELSSWPSAEALPAGTTVLLPVYRSTTPSRPGRSCWCRGICPPRRCRRGGGFICWRGARHLLWSRDWSPWADGCRSSPPLRTPCGKPPWPSCFTWRYNRRNNLKHSCLIPLPASGLSPSPRPGTVAWPCSAS